MGRFQRRTEIGVHMATPKSSKGFEILRFLLLSTENDKSHHRMELLGRYSRPSYADTRTYHVGEKGLALEAG